MEERFSDIGIVLSHESQEVKGHVFLKSAHYDGCNPFSNLEHPRSAKSNDKHIAEHA